MPTVIPWTNRSTSPACAPARSSAALHSIEHSLRLVVGGGRCLCRYETVRGGEHRVREGASDVYAKDHTADANSGGHDLRAVSNSSSRCWCDGQYLLPGSGTRWQAVPLRVVA